MTTLNMKTAGPERSRRPIGPERSRRIDGKKIADLITSQIKKDVSRLKLKPKLTIFLVGNSEENLSYTKIKEKNIKKIGGKFELVHYQKTPKFEVFAQRLREAAADPEITGIVIQQPLPPSLSTETIYDYLPNVKEIEGHKSKSPFHPPIGLATLTIIKYIFHPGNKKRAEELVVNMKRDEPFFRQILKRKQIVVIGRGRTGGGPIIRILRESKINFININSKSPDDPQFYKEADIIITTVGKKVLSASMLKPGVVLINIGLRREAGRWLGDYDEDDIKKLAGFYTPTPGGVGPLDIAYLMQNIFEATNLQTRKSSSK